METGAPAKRDCALLERRFSAHVLTPRPSRSQRPEFGPVLLLRYLFFYHTADENKAEVINSFSQVVHRF